MDVSTKQSLLVSCLKKSLFIPLLVGTLILTGCGEESRYSNSSKNANNSNNTVVDNPANTTDDPIYIWQIRLKLKQQTTFVILQEIACQRTMLTLMV